MASQHMHLDKFDGLGFHTWQMKVKYHLMRESIWNVVNGKEKQPSTREGELAWATRDDKALAIIALALSDNYIHHISDSITSFDAWDKLDKLFGAKGKNSKIALKIEFFELRLSSHESLAAHVNHMKSLMTQLSAIGAPVEEDDAVAVLLKSMPEEYGHLVTTLKNLPTPTLEEIISSLQDEERKTKGRGDEAFYINKRSNKASFKGKGIKCNHCGKTNHEEKDCYYKKKCNFCHKMNHEEKDCYHKKRASQAHLVSKEEEEPASKEEANNVQDNWAF